MSVRIPAILQALIAAAIIVVAVGVDTPSASAHEQLLDSTPVDSENLPTAPTEVALTFSAEVLTYGGAIIIADEQGRDWAASEPKFDRSVMSVQLEPDMPPAGYEIRWRVVSGDGHPISGLIPFTVGGAAAYERPDASAQTATEGDAPAVVDVEGQAQQETASIVRVMLIGGIGAAVAAALFVTLHLFRRRRAAGPDDSGPRAHDAGNAA